MCPPPAPATDCRPKQLQMLNLEVMKSNFREMRRSLCRVALICSVLAMLILLLLWQEGWAEMQLTKGFLPLLRQSLEPHCSHSGVPMPLDSQDTPRVISYCMSPQATHFLRYLAVCNRSPKTHAHGHSVLFSISIWPEAAANFSPNNFFLMFLPQLDNVYWA